MLLFELHDQDGNLVLVNLGAFLYASLSEFGGSTITFTGGSVLAVKETPEEIHRNLKQLVMQMQLRGGH